jgi:serine/threonine protein kinase/cephalosporin-C deacetylase-like acetyl esterase
MIGKTVSHYRILEKIGQGGMGDVYLAEDTKLQRTVALKFLPLELTRDPAARQRFVHEARAASALDHPNIGTIHEIDEAEGQSFISMTYYAGETLKDKIEKGPLTVEESINIAIQIAQGMAKAHSADIVHRDIKPANIMISEEEQVKIIDFGLAKLRGQTVLTKTSTTLGTVAYMSPEQARGTKVDQGTDIWAFGVILYEMLAGEKPFSGDYEQAVVYSIINDQPKSVKKLNPNVPPELERIVTTALNKKLGSRYPSAAEMLKDLTAYQDSLRAEELGVLNLQSLLRAIRRPKIALPAVFLVLILFLIALWLFNRQAKIRWAREEALPEIEQLIESNWRDFTNAYKLAVQAEKYIPNDPKLAELFSRSSLNINIKTEPSEVNIYMKDYKSPDSEWEFMGISPLDSIRVPIGIFRWKMEKEGYETVLAAASTWDIAVIGKNLLIPNDLIRILDQKGTIPPGMVRVPGAQVPLGKLDDFFIDRYEVTNRQYEAFVNSDGYKNKIYWKHEFITDGKVLSWEKAITEFVDQTGRPGPATWQAGDYPEGQGDYPVSGISWYEAAAYAAFVEKTLPTGDHWGLARGENTSLIRWPQLGGFAVFASFSNFQGQGPIAVGSLHGITSYGAYDMAGNVREWCWNETPKGRLVRGGAWNDNTYRFTELSQAPPFDRSSRIGFRCALYPDPENIPKSAFQMTKFDKTVDLSKEKPVSDAIFKIFKEQFSYDKTDLHANLENRGDSAEDWIHERVTFDAAYGNERIIAHLFLPKKTPPPYQTVIYFPGSASLFQTSSEDIESYYEFPVFLSFLVKNGRAVLYPVYKGTFERRDDALIGVFLRDNSHQYTDFLIQLVKDFKRSIDYLEIRQDIDHKKLAYYGMSWGGVMGAIIPTVEARLKTSIVLGGGLRGRGRPEANQINYITRVKIPTLMLHGKYDTICPLETSIRPMFDLLGTPDQHKELKLYETDHIPPRNEFIKETLTWLDRYLGPVK